MDSRNGEIMEHSALLAKMGQPDFEQYAKVVDTSSLSFAHKRILEEMGRVKIGRNDPCACGSGKKFKKCCYAGDSK